MAFTIEFCVGLIFIFMCIGFRETDMGGSFAVCGMINIVMSILLAALSGINLLLVIGTFLCNLPNLYCSFISSIFQNTIAQVNQICNVSS